MDAARYTGVAIALHWVGALLVFGGFGLGLFMTGLDFSPAKLRYYAWHKWIGITVFVVAAARLAWRAGAPPPPLPASVVAAAKTSAKPVAAHPATAAARPATRSAAPTSVSCCRG